MKMPHRRILLWILTVALLPCSSLAESKYMAVAGDGLVHKLQTGLYSDLFPEGSEADAGSFVLAMDILGSGRSERLLVPTSEDSYPEVPATLYYEKRSNTTYVLWEGLFNGIHPFLNLAGYDGTRWSEPITITGNVFADKGHAEFVIIPEPKLKRDSLLLESAVDRSVIYVTWQEVTSIGPQKYLVPIVLQGGKYLGWHETFLLPQFVENAKSVDGSPSRKPISGNVEDLLRIQPSTHINAITIGFTDIHSGQLVTLEVEMLPQVLSALAAQLDTLIHQHGETSNTVEELADKIRNSMMEFDGDFHPGMLDYLGDQIEALIHEHSTVAAAVARVPEKLGVHIIHIGSRFSSKGMIDDKPREILQIGQARHGGAPYHHLKISVIMEREAPEVGGPAVLFLSSTGLDALVAWQEEGRIVFRETDGPEWGERQAIELRDDLDEQAVYRILADRTLNR